MKFLFLTLLFIGQIAIAQQKKSKLFEFKASTCDEEADQYRLRTRIIFKELKGDTLTVRIGATATCCMEFSPKVMVKSDLIQLDAEEIGAGCECTCCYEFTYCILGVKRNPFRILFRGKEIELSPEKYKTYPIVFEILNRDTINYFDKYGLRQGKFNDPKRDSLMKEGYLEYKDGMIMKNIKLYPNKKVKNFSSREKFKNTEFGKERIDYTNYNYFIEYFESGKKKRECFSLNKNDSYKENGHCKEWDEEGILIYEGPCKKEN